MGSPLSPILGELIMDDLFEKLDHNFKDKIKFKIRFVDDSLFILNDQYFDILNFLNGYHQCLRFTFEKSFHMINFLDITVIRESDTI